MGGCGVQFAKRAFYGTFEYSDPNASDLPQKHEGWLDGSGTVYCVPQVGVNVSYGILDFATICDFVINKGVRLNVLFGLSF